MKNVMDINNVVLSGTIDVPFIYNNTSGAQKMYASFLNVRRLSGISDRIPLRIRECDLLNLPENIYSEKVSIRGNLNSLSTAPGVTMNVRIRKIGLAEDKNEDDNIVMVSGKITKIGALRQVNAGRLVRNFEIASLNFYGKEVYIPAVAWEENAINLTESDFGKKVSVVARFQSRFVIVQNPFDNVEKKTIYELAVREMAYCK